jgi:probable rRNA maturation factor
LAIHFFSEEISFSLDEEQQTISWIENILDQEKQVSKSVNYIFCSDDYLLKINKDYLNHDTLTDIITFDNSEEEGKIEADIFISIDRVKENALSLDKKFDEELHRVIIHGLLHLAGYNDKTEDDKAEMRKKEDACLSLR